MGRSLLLLLCAACGEWEPGDPIHAVGDSAWRAQVAEAADIWAAELDGCIEPFPVSDGDGMPVELIPADQWPHAPEEVGFTPTADFVHVRGDSSEDLVDVVVHEFGHRLGLLHSPDPTSIMFKSRVGNRFPNATDVLIARRHLGCL